MWEEGKCPWDDNDYNEYNDVNNCANADNNNNFNDSLCLSILTAIFHVNLG